MRNSPSTSHLPFESMIQFFLALLTNATKCNGDDEGPTTSVCWVLPSWICNKKYLKTCPSLSEITTKQATDPMNPCRIVTSWFFPGCLVGQSKRYSQISYLRAIRVLPMALTINSFSIAIPVFDSKDSMLQPDEIECYSPSGDLITAHSRVPST